MHYPLMYFLSSVVQDSSKRFHFTTWKKKKARSLVNVTCILVGHSGFINECNNESVDSWKESMDVFI
jgi:hypothetical protein